MRDRWHRDRLVCADGEVEHPSLLLRQSPDGASLGLPREYAKRATRSLHGTVLQLTGTAGVVLVPIAVAIVGGAAILTPAGDVEPKRAVVVWLVGVTLFMGWAGLSKRRGSGLGESLALSLLLRLAAALLLFSGIDALCPDSYGYDQEARRILASWASPISDPGGPAAIGTYAVPYAYAAMYAMVGPSMVAGFVMSAFVASIGAWGFCRGAEIGLRSWDVRGYWLAILFLPSLVIWPSIFGKDALIFGALGLVAYGAAGLFSGRGPAHTVALLVGLIVVGLVRPHIAFVVLCAWLGSYVRLPNARSRKSGSWLARVAVLVVGGAAIGMMVSRVLGGFDPEAALDSLSRFSSRTSYGGSAIAPVMEEGATVAEAVPGFFSGALRVLLRPYVWEAHKPAVLIAALEVLGVLLLLLARAPNAWRGLRSSDGQFLRFCVLISLFTMAIIGVAGNLGIIVRHRAMVWPFLLVPFLVSRNRRHGLRRAVYHYRADGNAQSPIGESELHRSGSDREEKTAGGQPC